MKIDILSKGAFESALVHLEQGDQFVSEAGAMYRASANVDVDVTTRSRGSGGLLAGVKRHAGGGHVLFVDVPDQRWPTRRSRRGTDAPGRGVSD